MFFKKKSTDQYKIEESSFSEVVVYWCRYLWPNRDSEIEDVSYINSSGNIDLSMQPKDKIYLIAKKNDASKEVIGVISGHSSSQNEYRVRGVWVSEDWRKQGIGSDLLKQLILRIPKKKYSHIWVMPRQRVMPFYADNNFSVEKEIFHYEFGPHYIAKWDPLKKHEDYS